MFFYENRSEELMSPSLRFNISYHVFEQLPGRHCRCPVTVQESVSRSACRSVCPYWHGIGLFDGAGHHSTVRAVDVAGCGLDVGAHLEIFFLFACQVFDRGSESGSLCDRCRFLETGGL